MEMSSLTAVPGMPMYEIALVIEANMLMPTMINGMFLPARK